MGRTIHNCISTKTLVNLYKNNQQEQVSTSPSGNLVLKDWDNHVLDAYDYSPVYHLTANEAGDAFGIDADRNILHMRCTDEKLTVGTVEALSESASFVKFVALDQADFIVHYLTKNKIYRVHC